MALFSLCGPPVAKKHTPTPGSNPQSVYVNLSATPPGHMCALPQHPPRQPNAAPPDERDQRRPCCRPVPTTTNFVTSTHRGQPQRARRGTPAATPPSLNHGAAPAAPPPASARRAPRRRRRAAPLAPAVFILCMSLGLVHDTSPWTHLQSRQAYSSLESVVEPVLFCSSVNWPSRSLAAAIHMSTMPSRIMPR